MNCLITGANGFLGRNIVELLIERGNSVMGISQKNNNLSHIKQSNFHFIQNTKNNYSDIKNKILNFNPNVIIHTAWFGGNSYNDVNNLSQYTINFELGLSLLDIIKEIKSEISFIGFGSFAEYGILNKKAIETQIDNPNTHYGLSKSSFKCVSKMFCEQNNIKWSWVRPCYVYGSGDVAGRVIPTVITKLKNKQRITLSSCNVTIDYLHVDDFCSGIINMIDNNLDGIYNICSGYEYNLKTILQHLQTLNGTDLITFDPSLDRIYAPKYICGSSEKLQSMSDWKPSKNIYTELKKLYNE